ncbi:hypothetical protein KDW_64270 [Dictyobacter vulcani]|uniref:HEAT repeat domain-containing protein n=1 Tax=Dictyobacter vulcani TaxID=2607529 RepID=A0A5J4KWB4_9CHLR|nr:hypothetical protein [Dictyobacter vulcani]GER92265.1 hypothetical protein KDW_64270 [Dictyobacter vulcani]
MPEDEALKLLQDAPLNKITVAKEVVRLMGELGTEAAYQQLQAMQQQELHRDVRIALLRALWSYLERPETWESFRRAAQDPDLSIANRRTHSRRWPLILGPTAASGPAGPPANPSRTRSTPEYPAAL